MGVVQGNTLEEVKRLWARLLEKDRAHGDALRRGNIEATWPVKIK